MCHLNGSLKDDANGGIKTMKLNDLGVTEMPSGVAECSCMSQWDTIIVRHLLEANKPTLNNCNTH